MFSFLGDRVLESYLENAFKNDIAKDYIKKLDSRNLTDEYLDKTNSDKTDPDNQEDSVIYKSSNLVYVDNDKDTYRVFVLMPGVSKDDISITYVENDGCKHLKFALNEGVEYEYSKYFNFLQSIDKTWKIDLPSKAKTPKISLDNGVLKIECDLEKQEKEIKLSIQ